MSSRPLNKLTDNKKFMCWELFSLTYGVFVHKMLKEYNSQVEEINRKLDQMGYNIGIRLIEDLQVKTNVGRCKNMSDTANAIVNIGFKQYTGITPKIINWNNANTEFSIMLDNNPLAENVELDPISHAGLWYSNAICGIIRGCLEMVQLKTDVFFVKDVLNGDDCTEIRVVFVGKIKETLPAGEELN